MIAMMIAAAMMVQASPADRTAYVSCLKAAVNSAKGANVTPDGFKDYALRTCESAGGGLKSKLTAFNVKNGMSKKAAAEDAQLQLEDYVYSAEENYRFAAEAPQ